MMHTKIVGDTAFIANQDVRSGDVIITRPADKAKAESTHYIDSQAMASMTVPCEHLEQLTWELWRDRVISCVEQMDLKSGVGRMQLSMIVQSLKDDNFYGGSGK